MKRTLSTIALAAPLATVAISLGSPALAQPADPTDTEITNAQLVPDVPEDEIPAPPDPERPDGPGGLENDQPQCPTHGPCGDGPDDETVPDDDGDGDGGEKNPDDGDDFKKPNRIDAGAASQEQGTQNGGLELAWLMAGTGIITATGAAYAVRRRSRARA